MEDKIKDTNTHQVWLSSGHPPATAVPFKVEIVGSSSGSLGFAWGGMMIMFGLFAIASALH